MKFKIKQDFYDWESNVKRLAGEELEITEERYAELADNFASNGVAVPDILEEVSGTESYNPVSYSSVSTVQTPQVYVSGEPTALSQEGV
ncbi:Uncharacterised protein [Streptococcus pneumoniae]|nr:Uncharacterised protein [Streptococcus pneumoniae]